jgi:hypothetical protein
MELEEEKMNESVKSGMTLGGVIAVTISWSINHSIWWCIFHGIFSWFYVIYYACGGGHKV